MAKRKSSPHAYLYVVSPSTASEWVKVGRSKNPARRLYQLQVGQGDKLILRGQWKVPTTEAPAREAALKLALRPLRLKGEVFRADHKLACAVAKWIASGAEPDEFISMAVECEAAGNEAKDLRCNPSSSGRWANSRAVAALEDAEERYSRLNDSLDELDLARASEISPLKAWRNRVFLEGNNL